ncbi:hypothetical protein FE257_012479 [Aspergillus nanangensis]|uniref:Major facilitator superfamily (MFS) profile domain-containing protein n=1 Tax=Aspergillus nanangensis TaxID=2582783 RepID=A0AAD4GYX0_ASPNN|nr:hypothetical protein FE257_012479 [Aspergillus nanangensis]
MGSGQEESENVEVESQSPNWGSALSGTRLWLGGCGCGLSLFLTALESTIVSTTLVAITNDFGGFGQSSWIITAYLLTYAGFLLIWSKASDIWGIKPCLLTSIILFTAFSGGCGAAQTLSQLIICRAFQGMGGAGIYSLTLFSFIRMVSKEHYSTASSSAGAIFSLGLVLGPLMGGAIAEHGNWRWVFLCNVPSGAASWCLIWFFIPTGFPNYPSEGAASQSTAFYDQAWTKARSFLRRVDIIGVIILLTASSFAIAALQEGNYGHSWKSGLVISLLVISGICWILFPLWERFLSRSSLTFEPVLPWRLMFNRTFLGGAFRGSFTSGSAVTVCVVQIPQRFQIVYGSSPLGAGVKLLAFAVSNPLGIMLCAVMSGKTRIPFVYIELFGIILQSVGLFLVSEIAPDTHLWPGQFGYLVLAGLGTGLAMAAFYMMVPIAVALEDQAVAMGTTLQLRMLGGAIGVAACTTIPHSYLQNHLLGVIPPENIQAVVESSLALKSLPHGMQVETREIFAAAYNLQMKLAGAFSLAQIIGVVLAWKRTNVRVTKE